MTPGRAVRTRPRVPTVLRVGAPLVGVLVAVATGAASVLLGRAGSAAVQLAATTQPVWVTSAAPVTGTGWPPQAFAATGYQISAPGAPLTVLDQLAGLFGVSGMVSVYNGTAFVAVAANGARVTYDTSSGVGRWSYDGPAGTGPTVGALHAFLARQWDLAVPPTHRAHASLAVSVDGTRSALRVRIVQHDGLLTHAAGPALVVSASRDLGLRPPAAALDALRAARAGSVGSPVRIEHAALTWMPYRLADATTWLLPTYRVTGTRTTGTWTASVLAVASTRVHLP
ncbi:MAG: hypothetical protein ACP5OV_06470 [Acidimicrobiales bacterium]